MYLHYFPLKVSNYYLKSIIILAKCINKNSFFFCRKRAEKEHGNKIYCGLWNTHTPKLIFKHSYTTHTSLTANNKKKKKQKQENTNYLLFK